MKNVSTKTAAEKALGFTGGLTTVKKQDEVKTAVVKAKKACDDDIITKATECGAYFKALQKQDIREQSANARVYNALLEGVIIKYAKEYAEKDKMFISVTGLTAVTFSLGRLRQAGILTDVKINIQDTNLACIQYTLDITAINPFKLREIVETYKLDITVEFPEDCDDDEPTFSW